MIVLTVSRTERKRIKELVHDHLSGAEILQCVCTAEEGEERTFVVLWRNEREFGTHRALIHYGQDEQALIWGHYFPGQRGYAEAYVDFNQRIADET